MNEELFVVAETVERVEDCEMLGFFGVEGSGKNNTVRNVVAKNFAGDGVALDATGCEGGRNAKETKEKTTKRKADPSLHSG